MSNLRGLYALAGGESGHEKIAASLRSSCNRKCGLQGRILKNLDEIFEKVF